MSIVFYFVFDPSRVMRQLFQFIPVCDGLTHSTMTMDSLCGNRMNQKYGTVWKGFRSMCSNRGTIPNVITGIVLPADVLDCLVAERTLLPRPKQQDAILYGMIW